MLVFQSSPWWNKWNGLRSYRLLYHYGDRASYNTVHCAQEMQDLNTLAVNNNFQLDIRCCRNSPFLVLNLLHSRREGTFDFSSLVHLHNRIRTGYLVSTHSIVSRCILCHCILQSVLNLHHSVMHQQQKCIFECAHVLPLYRLLCTSLSSLTTLIRVTNWIMGSSSKKWPLTPTKMYNKTHWAEMILKNWLFIIRIMNLSWFDVICQWHIATKIIHCHWKLSNEFQTHPGFATLTWTILTNKEKAPRSNILLLYLVNQPSP